MKEVGHEKRVETQHQSVHGFVLAHGDGLPGPASFKRLAKRYQQAARHPAGQHLVPT